MANSRKFVAKTRDISLTVKRADSFNISYVNCEKGKFKLEEDQNAIRLIQTEKISPFTGYSGYLKAVPKSSLRCQKILISARLKLNQIKS